MNKSFNHPPKLAKWLLHKLTGWKVRYSALGDFDEIFHSIAEEKGSGIAIIWYWFQSIKSIPSFFIDKIYWGVIMLVNYSKLAFRNLLKNKQSSFINIFGLSAAIGVSIVSFLFFDFNYYRDTFHKNAANIFLVESVVENKNGDQLWGSTPIPLGPSLKGDFPQVKSFVRLNRIGGIVRFEDKVFNEVITFVDNDFFNVFTFPLLYGDKNKILTDNNIVLSYETAEKYFGNENPLGKQITLNVGNEIKETFLVNGVAQKLPKNSSFFFDVLMPYDKMNEMLSENFNDWTKDTRATFILLNNASEADYLKSNLSKYISVQNDANFDRKIKEFRLEPLRTMAQNSYKILGDIVYINILPGQTLSLLSSGLFLLLLACFNYVNISLISASGRFKEIGIRKVMGGKRLSIVIQFLGENIIFCMLALLMGVLLGKYFFAPGFNSLFRGFNFEVNVFENTRLLLFLIILLIATGIGSGLYPALYISSFQPANIFRGKSKLKSKNRFTKTLLAFQFVLSIILLVNGVTLIQNADYQSSRDWGYEQDQVITIPLQEKNRFIALNNAVRSNTNVVSTAGSQEKVGYWISRINIEAELNKYEVVQYGVGDNFFETYGMEIKKGRGFDKEIKSDIEQSIIVNETFAKMMNWDDPIGKRILFSQKPYYIIGVVKDFHYVDFMWKIEPVVMFKSPEEEFMFLAVKAKAGKVIETENYIEKKWKELYPDSPYHGFFQDQVFDIYLTAMKSVAKTCSVSAIISLIITCMGIFGLVTLSIEKRMKELSIRKVLGASVSSIAKLINNEFIKIFIFSFIIAVPVSYYLINLLLDSIWKYRPELSYLPFLLAGVLLIISAAITVVSQIYKASVKNPVDYLRYE